MTGHSRLRRATIAVLMAAMMLMSTVPAAGGIPATGGMSGTVVNEAGDPIEDVDVYISRWIGSSWSSVGSAVTLADGAYSFPTIDPGEYKVFYRDDANYRGADVYAYEFYDDKIHGSDITTVTVSSGSVATGIDATLTAGATISGKVKDEWGDPLESVNVRAYYEMASGSWAYHRAAVTDTNGDYQIAGLPADDFAIKFWTNGDTYFDELWDNVHTPGGGSPNWVTVGAGVDLTGYDAKLDYTDEEGPAISSDVVTDTPYAGSASIEITATDEFTGDSGIRFTGYWLNDEVFRSESGSSTTCDTDRPGQHTITYKAKDNAANYSEYVTKQFEILRDEAASEDEIEGTDRYKTGVDASQKGFATADSVVIATGMNWPDALGGAALAGALDGPLLLTTPSALHSAVKAEIERLGASEAWIVGGESAVSSDVEKSLDALLGAANVHRLAGTDRYKTGDLIAAQVIAEQGGGFDGNAFVATGGNFPDALAASSIAAAKGWPMLLTPYGGKPTLPAEVTDVTILGGTGVVTETTESWLNGRLGDAHVDRIGGKDRYETGAKIAQFGIDEGLFWDGVGIATGEGFPDALSGGAMLGSQGTVLLLTPGETLSDYAESLLEANKEYIEEVQFLGGDAVLGQGVRADAMGAVQ